jgi:hypothetical protein
MSRPNELLIALVSRVASANLKRRPLRIQLSHKVTLIDRDLLTTRITGTPPRPQLGFVVCSRSQPARALSDLIESIRSDKKGSNSNTWSIF